MQFTNLQKREKISESATDKRCKVEKIRIRIFFEFTYPFSSPTSHGLRAPILSKPFSTIAVKRYLLVITSVTMNK